MKNPHCLRAQQRAAPPHFRHAAAALIVLGGLTASGCSRAPATSAAPAATAAASPCRPAPFAEPLFLRGSLTNWALRDDLRFQYRCDGYVLNVAASGSHEFKIADAAFQPAHTFAAGSREDADVTTGAAKVLSTGSSVRWLANLRYGFAGAQTLHLRFGADGAATLTIGPHDFDDPADAPVDDAVARSLGFDSRDQNDKAPFGAVTAGSEVAFALSAAPGATSAALVVEKRRLEGPQDVVEYTEVARVPLVRASGGEHERWRGTFRFADIGVYGYYFVVQVAGHTFLYQNNADPIYWTRELGANGRGVATGVGDATRIRRFRQTVYRADYVVPDWARDAVFYYIFPERFRNGDRRNDPKPGPNTFRDKSVEVHANWLDKPWLPRSGDGSDDLYGNDFFGGDLAGIRQKLDYIRALGANTLYLTPIFTASSNHKYDAADYRNVDPHFGSNVEFEQLARAAKQRGIRIVLDASLNHTGTDSIYFDRFGKWPGLGAFEGGRIQPQSPYADWYAFDPAQSDPEKQYHGWAGAHDLPELNKASPSYRAFAYGAPDSIMKLWLDRGASGWRMDVAPWVPDDFWREWRAAVKSHRPDALTICETQFESSKFFLGDEFDATMNYVFRNAVEDYANGVDARKAFRAIELMRELYPPQSFYAQMNLLSTHDSARALHDFGWRDAQSDAATVALAKRRLRLAVFFQMTFPGAPAVLYADEVGVTGGDDPFNRVTYPWADLGGKPDRALLADYRKLIRLRHEHPVLRHGSIDAPAYLDEHLIVHLRRDGDTWAIVAMNNDRAPRDFDIAVPAALQGRTFVDVVAGGKATASGGRVHATVPALSGLLLESRR